jgi:hypothetical protein
MSPSSLTDQGSVDDLQIKPCPIPNGTGNKRGNKGQCILQSCNSGYTAYNNACYPSSQSCTVANGSGVQQFDSSTGQYGACQVTSCNAGYVIVNNSCQAAPTTSTQSCPIANGTGLQTVTNGVPGPCVLVSCNSGYVAYNNTCVAASRSCPIANGSGTQSFNTSTGQYGTCQATSCNSGYALYQNACYQLVKSCTIANGSGQQSFNASTGQYGTCQAVSCNSGYHLDSATNSCVADQVQNIQDIKVQASDNVGVVKVEIYVNTGSGNVLLCTVSSPASDGYYHCNWPVSGSAGQSVTILAKAFDLQGNVGQSTSTVTLQ